MIGLRRNDYSVLTLTLLLAACATQNAPPAEPKQAPTPTPEPVPVLVTSSKDEAPPAAEASGPALASPIAQAVAAPDRSADDRALDAQRKPAELLRFFGIAPGQRVAELGAGGGYTAELLARIVGPSGKVYGQNSKFILERFAEAPWSARLQKPIMQNVVRLDTEFDAPFPPEVRDLDGVLLIMFYHDTVWLKVDRKRMNQAIHAALKPGGVYGVVDHNAAKGAGVSAAETLHRIEPNVVIEEVTQAGFELQETANFLENSADTRDWNASPRSAGERRGQSDRFVLRFVKRTP